MKRILGNWLGLVALLVLLQCFGPAQAGAFEPRVPDTFFGISEPDLWYETTSNLGSKRDAQLDAMKQYGIDWVRTEVGWAEIEPTAPSGGTHVYTWTKADELVRAFAQRGMTVFPMLMGTPDWARSAAANAHSCGRRAGISTANASNYGAYATAIAKRYGRNGTFWAANPSLPYKPMTRYEIWNEPNFRSFWCPAIDPAAFGAMLDSALTGIHGADSGAEVGLGGLAAIKEAQTDDQGLRGMPVDTFLDQMLAAKPAIAGQIDGVGLHAYDLDPDINLSLLGWMRRVLDARGMSRAQILLTEFGWKSGNLIDSLLESVRAANYATFTSEVARTNCNVGAVAAHSWSSDQLNPLNPDDWWGIASPITNIPYLSGLAYLGQVALLEGRGATAPPRNIISLCGSDPAPDQDGDGTPDPQDDYPTDPTKQTGSGETPPDDQPPVEPKVAPSRVPDDFFGTDVVELPSDGAQMANQFAAMHSARIALTHQRVEWAGIEPTGPSDPSASKWAAFERTIFKRAQQGIGLEPSFGVAPSWASGDTTGQFAAFLKRFAQRYGRGGTFWSDNGQLDPHDAVTRYEIWDSANQDSSAPNGTASAASYGSMYSAARSALKSVDPNAQALMSVSEFGEAGTASEFIRSVVAATPALRGQVDGVYVMATDSRSVDSLEALVRKVRQALMDSGNPNAPIYLGFGAPTAGPGAVTDADRAQMISDVTSRMARGDCGVAGVFVHAWTTPESDTSNPWNWFGIADRDDASLTQSATAYKQIASQLLGYEAGAPRAAVHPCSGQAPDSDGDGTPDAIDDAPLDPNVKGPATAPPPAPTIGSGVADSTRVRDAAFTYNAAGASTYECRLNEQPWGDCPSAGQSYARLADGAYRFEVRAVDAQGLVGDTAARSWKVDNVGPTTKIELKTSGPVLLGDDATFAVTQSEDVAHSYCQIDSGGWESCGSSYTVIAPGVGDHTVRAFAQDAAGNFSVAVASADFEVIKQAPLQAPTLSQAPAEGAVTNAKPTFGFAAAPSGVSAECRFDSEAFAPCSSANANTARAALAEGAHVFEVRHVRGDETGPSAQRHFTVDSTSPAIKLAKRTLHTRSRSTKVRFTASDANGVARVECSRDGKAWKACRSPYATGRLKIGRHRIRIRATDTVGNTSRPKLVLIRISR